ncbi:MAG: hypothetical protein GY853_14635 [PVC group bacterium]|nr:hypothetical protein [PVC group bacterium]
MGLGGKDQAGRKMIFITGMGYSQTAGATAAVTTEAFNRQLTENTYSLMISLVGTAALAATKTLSFKLEIEESADNSTWDAATVLQATTLLKTSPSGGLSTSDFAAQYNLSLYGRKQYVRIKATPTLSNTTTDTIFFSLSLFDTGNSTAIVTDDGWNYTDGTDTA